MPMQENLYDQLGANFTPHGVLFRAWAPNANAVSVIGAFNNWDPKSHPLQLVGEYWEGEVPDLRENETYRFWIETKAGHHITKTDPFSHYFEKRPHNSALTFDVNRYRFLDEEWMEKRQKSDWKHTPLNIYEVHLGSWKLKEGHFLNYRELGRSLATYVKEMGYTHVELLPVTEHPLDESWGYQVTGFFAPTSRFGSPEDFQAMVDHFHKEGIGVIIDWVPGHFPIDDHALARFDGTELFEHSEKGLHPDWSTLHFDYGSEMVSSFLISSAHFWLDKMHVDGLRVDAVYSILKDEEAAAIDFLKKLNESVHRRFPGAMMIAEDSSGYPGVTDPKGLGFDFKWNMGWMFHTLKFFTTEPKYRIHEIKELLHPREFFHTEAFINILSHDEVGNGWGSLISKMPGSHHEKIEQLKLLLTYLVCFPGKNLLFMGGEFAHFEEWNGVDPLQWELLNDPDHKAMQEFVKELNHFYLKTPALWGDEVQWIDNASYIRGDRILCIHNFFGEEPKGEGRLVFETKYTKIYDQS